MRRGQYDVSHWERGARLSDRRLDPLDTRDLREFDQVALTSFCAARRAVGYLFRNYILIEVVSARENVAAPIRSLRCDESAARTKAAGSVPLVRLGHRLNPLSGELSNAHPSRAAIARTLGADSRLRLSDEPIGNSIRGGVARSSTGSRVSAANAVSRSPPPRTFTDWPGLHLFAALAPSP